MAEENITEESNESTHRKEGDVSFVYDVPVTLQVRLGEAVLSVEDVLKCGKGSVIPLKQKVGEPFPVYLQNRQIAEGEVVETGDYIGVKITNVLRAPSTEQDG